MYREILTYFLIATIFVGAVALAIIVFPKAAAAQMCLPETQTKTVITSVGNCCFCNPPARRKTFQTYERHRTPDCGWTDWHFVRSDTHCVVDWSCCLNEA